MIIAKKQGDILSFTDNPTGDIIIAMNTEAKELTKLGREYLGGSMSGPLEKGTVLTFKYDEVKRIHMVVIHDLEIHGWSDASQYLRIGLDNLWKDAQTDERPREFSIVRMGLGRIGRKYQADPVALQHAMEDSFLPVTLFYKPDDMVTKKPVAMINKAIRPMYIIPPAGQRIPLAV